MKLKVTSKGTKHWTTERERGKERKRKKDGAEKRGGRIKPPKMKVGGATPAFNPPTYLNHGGSDLGAAVSTGQGKVNRRPCRVRL